MNAETKTLVDAIVRGVVAQLEHRQTPAGPVVLVLSLPDKTLASAVREALGQEADIRFLDNEAGVEPDMYVLPELSCADMADLALGTASSIAMRRVLDLLLQGKDVRTLGFAFRAHAHTAPQALLRLYEGYARTLASYGLTEIAPVATGCHELRHSLITAEHIAAVAATAGELRVPHTCIVTQLAMDEAAKRGLCIVKTL